MKDKTFWSFSPKSEAQAVNRLYICDEIARYRSWFGDEVTSADFRSELAACRGDIELMLDSPGGDAFAGNAIYDMLREYSASGKGRIVAKVSLAASAASIIAMAADEIQISLVGTIMIHNPWSALQGNANDLRATADILDEIREGQIRAYMHKTGLSHDEVVALMDGENNDGTYMNAKTAMELGFADKILNEDDEGWVSDVAKAKIAACMIRMEGQDEDEDDKDEPEAPENPDTPDDTGDPEEPEAPEDPDDTEKPDDEEDDDKDDEEERKEALRSLMLALCR